ncbi:cytochrome b/b6 domain-containing protein [Zafaria sp. Z1313]|uniref:cytochrome b/b6 domain-containing protein n=1 Tax=unclassified Zafaria TaxID=2828765 RepID=UPI002E798938|nr:cytochrome b/b6 domain-containing protein [Zafaria sp. J156]MEE1620342.1 cytochrome b/b6 domain-containing protein [Zafaria sp. J156]
MKSTASKDARAGARGWLRFAWLAGGGLVLLGLGVLAARWLVGLEGVQEFLARYPGHTELPAAAPTGIPVWMSWQHFLNAFFILLIIRSGWQVRTQQRPPAHWTRNNKGLVKTRNPPKRISINLWFHLTLDALWVLNGFVFIVLLFATGHWMRIVPTSWEVFPNAVSAGLQYLSLDWPVEDGWVNYNSLQLLTYFLTVFVAAPLAIITGLRMSEAWPKKAAVNKAYPVELARAVHFPVMLYFVFFVITHVALVLSTGAVRNLNHMYGARDDGTWIGFWFFAGSVVAMAAAWFLSRPVLLAPIASLMGKVSR